MKTTEDINKRFTFLIRAVGFLAQMSYDICSDLNGRVQDYANEVGRRIVLSQKLKTSVKKMEEARERLQKHALNVASEVYRIYDEIEEKNPTIKALTHQMDCLNAYDYILQMVSYLMLACENNPEEIEKLYNTLRGMLDESIAKTLPTPDFSAMNKSYKTTIKQ